jgi:hypothetical protein
MVQLPHALSTFCLTLNVLGDPRACPAVPPRSRGGGGGASSGRDPMLEVKMRNEKANSCR